jgi:hypothetical protein
MDADQTIATSAKIARECKTKIFETQRKGGTGGDKFGRSLCAPLYSFVSFVVDGFSDARYLMILAMVLDPR